MAQKDAAFKKSQDDREVQSTRGAAKTYARGIAGGVLFSLPLLYTMEMWWAGFIVSPGYLLLAIGATFVLLIGYNRYAGIRKDSTWWDVVTDAVEELGIAFVVSLLVLWLLNRINMQMSADEIIGKTIMEALVVAIGISVGTAQLGESAEQEDEDPGAQQDEQSDHGEDAEFSSHLRLLLRYTTLHITGGVLIASSVAPTDEIPKLAAEMANWSLLLLVVFSIALTAIVLYFSDFHGSKTAVRADSTTEMILDISLTYATALIVSLVLLWFFGRLGGGMLSLVSRVVVLALPTTVGAAAGRLLIQ